MSATGEDRRPVTNDAALDWNPVYSWPFVRTRYSLSCLSPPWSASHFPEHMMA